jgi:hypothetical protein
MLYSVGVLCGHLTATLVAQGLRCLVEQVDITQVLDRVPPQGEVAIAP